jgi:hypothetical protein
MLHCNMNTSTDPLQLSLEDLLGDLQHARRSDDMSRLALLAYCEVRRWARQAGEHALAERSTELITRSPHANREQFMAQMDVLIGHLEQVHARLLAQSARQSNSQSA